MLSAETLLSSLTWQGAGQSAVGKSEDEGRCGCPLALRAPHPLRWDLYCETFSDTKGFFPGQKPP